MKGNEKDITNNIKYPPSRYIDIIRLQRTGIYYGHRYANDYINRSCNHYGNHNDHYHGNNVYQSDKLEVD